MNLKLFPIFLTASVISQAAEPQYFESSSSSSNAPSTPSVVATTPLPEDMWGKILGMDGCQGKVTSIVSCANKALKNFLPTVKKRQLYFSYLKQSYTEERLENDLLMVGLSLTKKTSLIQQVADRFDELKNHPLFYLMYQVDDNNSVSLRKLSKDHVKTVGIKRKEVIQRLNHLCLLGKSFATPLFMKVVCANYPQLKNPISYLYGVLDYKDLLEKFSVDFWDRIAPENLLVEIKQQEHHININRPFIPKLLSEHKSAKMVYKLCIDYLSRLHKAEENKLKFKRKTTPLYPFAKRVGWIGKKLANACAAEQVAFHDNMQIPGAQAFIDVYHETFNIINFIRHFKHIKSLKDISQPLKYERK